jgi:hypothetical protein
MACEVLQDVAGQRPVSQVRHGNTLGTTHVVAA